MNNNKIKEQINSCSNPSGKSVITLCDRYGDNFYIEIEEFENNKGYWLRAYRDFDKTKLIGHLIVENYIFDSYSEIMGIEIILGERKKHLGKILVGTMVNLLKNQKVSTKILARPVPPFYINSLIDEKENPFFKKIGFQLRDNIVPEGMYFTLDLV